MIKLPGGVGVLKLAGIVTLEPTPCEKIILALGWITGFGWIIWILPDDLYVPPNIGVQSIVNDGTQQAVPEQKFDQEGNPVLTLISTLLKLGKPVQNL